MPGGSVRERIRAAEAATSSNKSQNVGASSRKGQRLSLKTDEHIKEEFLKRSDGGWHKKVDIGQQEKFMPPPAGAPIIKLTSETPVMQESPDKLQGKLSKEVPGAFETLVEQPETETAKWTRVEQMEAEQQAAMDAEAAKMKSPDRSGTARDVPNGCSVNLADEAPMKIPSKSKSKSKASKSHQARVEDDDGFYDPPVEPTSPREKVLFDPVAYQEKKQAKAERRASRQAARTERLLVVEEQESEPPARSWLTRSPSIRILRVNDDEDHEERPRRKHRSRSRSAHKHEDEHISPATSPRRSNNSLWPSFSNSERRSMSNIFESPKRPRSIHARTYSDDHSTMTTHSEISVKKLEFAEYVAGKKLDHLPLIPPKSPPRPMGFVRSLSHTGQYSEGYTREKKLLRKPSDDEVVVDHVDHDWEHKDRRHSRHRSNDHRNSEPWQLKMFQEIARR